MEELKSLLPLLSAFLVILAFFAARSWENRTRTRDAVEDERKRRCELDTIIAEIRKQADERYDTTAQLCTMLSAGISDLKERLDKIDIGKINTRLAIIEQGQSVWWEIVRNKVLDIIKTYPTNMPYDELVEKLQKKIIELDEIALLKEMMITESQKYPDRLWAFTLAEAFLRQEEAWMLVKNERNGHKVGDSDTG
jgi:hypothetical protein